MENIQEPGIPQNPTQRSFVVFRLNNAATTGDRLGTQDDFDFAGIDQPQAFVRQHGMNHMRNHLFHVMLVKLSLGYAQHTTPKIRRLVEFFALATALISLSILVYLHYLVPAAPTNCLDHIKDVWPKRGIVRVEIVKNWDEYNAYIAAQQQQRRYQTHFSLKDVFLHGPKALPDELKKLNRFYESLKTETVDETSLTEEKGYMKLLAKAWDLFYTVFVEPLLDIGPLEPLPHSKEFAADRTILDFLRDGDNEETHDHTSVAHGPFLYVVEYSLHHGLLRLPVDLRTYYNIPVMLVQLSATDENQCLAPYRRQSLTSLLMGFDDILMNSVKTLSENLSEKGYLYDLVKNEHYHFVSYAPSKFVFLTALFVMLIFTFAISMLLRFSHQQIFLFIVELLSMFETNQPLVFPIAPLLTVLLALVGMEAIMSEVFIDSTTAFYVILLVWIADQYDAICCHSSIGRKHWLKFFYLYHYTFYAYHYRYSGQYTGSALITSAAFVVHSMIYFFHHYELPIILYNDELQRLIRRLQQQSIELHQRGRNEVETPDIDSTLPLGEVIRAISISHATPESLRTDILREAQRMNLTVLGSEPIIEPSNTESNATPSLAIPQSVIEEAEITATNLIQQTMNELFDYNSAGAIEETST